jgi:hypothetical protein
MSSLYYAYSSQLARTLVMTITRGSIKYQLNRVGFLPEIMYFSPVFICKQFTDIDKVMITLLIVYQLVDNFSTKCYLLREIWLRTMT